MRLTLHSDEQGALVLPPGSVMPRTRIVVEGEGNQLVMRSDAPTAPAPSPAADDDKYDPATAAAKIQWLEHWMDRLPPSPAIPLDALRRDSIYD